MRNYGFGLVQGLAALRPLDGSADIALTINSWSNSSINAGVPGGVAGGRYQLVVTNSIGVESALGTTVTIGPVAGAISTVLPGQSIQTAIDVASAGDLILVAPGTYEELVIVHKPVALQGAGAFSTTINAVKAPAEKLALWIDKVFALLTANQFDTLPGQDAGFDPQDNEQDLFLTEQGAGITVVANEGEFSSTSPGSIDGFTITGGDSGGGIFVNGYVNYLTISNNRIISNAGNIGGGIHIGNPILIDDETGPIATYSDGRNDNILIRDNHITQNGALAGPGGGIGLFAGTENYVIRENFICGNFAQGDGAGVGTCWFE